jgi:hypothetical protein
MQNQQPDERLSLEIRPQEKRPRETDKDGDQDSHRHSRVKDTLA